MLLGRYWAEPRGIANILYFYLIKSLELEKGGAGVSLLYSLTTSCCADFGAIFAFGKCKKIGMLTKFWESWPFHCFQGLWDHLWLGMGRPSRSICEDSLEHLWVASLVDFEYTPDLGRMLKHISTLEVESKVGVREKLSLSVHLKPLGPWWSWCLGEGNPKTMES